MTYYKIFTHDYHSPIRGGDPVWDGTFPYKLPTVQLDTSDQECSAGWNFTADLAVGFRIAGLWPTGRPSLAVVVEPSADAIQRGEKWRSSGLMILRLATANEINEALEVLSTPFGKHASVMVRGQLAWRHALSRPKRDYDVLMRGLQEALKVRGLKWQIKRHSRQTIRASWASWDTWDTWDSWTAGASWDARASWATRASWVAGDAWDAWTARASWAARGALAQQSAALDGWVDTSPDLLTVGLRDAYEYGLELALPTGPKELGFVW